MKRQRKIILNLKEKKNLSKYNKKCSYLSFTKQAIKIFN